MRASVLHQLCSMELKREPVLQKRSKNLKKSVPNANRWDMQIGLQKANIEALIGQAVGDLLHENAACDNCNQLDGKFANCIRVPGLVECANCHWDSPMHRCSFLRAQKTSEAPMAATLRPENNVQTDGCTSVGI